MKPRRHNFHMVILKFHGMMAFQPIASYDDSVHEIITIKWLHATHKEGVVLGFGKFFHSILATQANRLWCRLRFSINCSRLYPARRSRRIKATGLHAISTRNHSPDELALRKLTLLRLDDLDSRLPSATSPTTTLLSRRRLCKEGRC